MKPKFCGRCGNPSYTGEHGNRCPACQFVAPLQLTMDTTDKFLRIERDEPVSFQLLGDPKPVQCHHGEHSWLAYEMTVLHDNKEKTLRLCKMAMQQLVLLIKTGHPTNGRYQIARSGYGLQTSYEIIALDKIQTPSQPSIWSKLFAWMH